MRCSPIFAYTRSKMSFHPLTEISDGDRALRPRSSVSAARVAGDAFRRDAPGGGFLLFCVKDRLRTMIARILNIAAASPASLSSNRLDLRSEKAISGSLSPRLAGLFLWDFLAFVTCF